MASSIPNDEGDIRLVRQMGIRAILSLSRRAITCHPGITPELLESLDITWLHEPVYDGGVPDKRQMVRQMKFMLLMKKQARPFLVHCRWGIARTGVVLWLYYRTQGWTTSQILPFLASKRTDGIHPLGPANAVQRAFVGGQNEPA